MDARALWILARPRGLPWVALSPITGHGLAHWGRALPLQAPVEIALVCLAWGLLGAGTLWWNAALDRDQGPVLYGSPVAVPARIERAANLALAASAGIAAMAGLVPGLCAAACGLLAVGYSHPRVAWKARPLAGPAVNVLGFGVLSPAAGFAVVEVALDLRSALLIAVSALSVLGAYFVAQVFQEREDRGRGYRTLVATSGPRAVLLAARVAFGAAHGLGLGLAVAGWIPRACLVALPACFAVDRALGRWRVAPDSGGERHARELLFLALFAGLLFVAGATGAWVWQVGNGLPLAGLGTVGGVPGP